MSRSRHNILREYDFLQVHEVQLDSDVNFYSVISCHYNTSVLINIK